MSTICPFCDSNNTEKIAVSENFPVPFCGDVQIRHETFKCLDCEEDGDFDHSMDKSLAKAINKANAESAPHIMDSLTQSGITMTYLEKALRLPFRTTSRWRRGRLSHSSLALLRLIRFSPALLQAADDNFSDAALARYHVSRTWDYFRNNTHNPTCLVASGPNSFHVIYSGFTQPQPITYTTSTKQQITLEQVK
jgi:hypothetical protein